MADPRLVYRNAETGEGILVGDDGLEHTVHVPSLGAMTYVDETQDAPPVRTVVQTDPMEPIRASSYEDGILPSAAPSVVVSPRAHADAVATPLPTFTREPVIPADVPPEWLASTTPRVDMPMPPTQASRDARTAALYGTQRPTPTAAPMPPGMRGPTPEEIARGRAATSAPTASAPSPRPRAAGGAAPSPRTPVLSPQFVRDFSQPEAFDETIASITGQPQATRGTPGNPFDLVDRQTQIAQREAQLAADDARRQQQAVAASEDERRAIEDDRQAAVQGAQDRYRRATDRVANAQLDPNHWFRDQGAFGTLGATFAVALGALGSAVQGSSTNSALDQINQAIDRDIDAQRAEMDSARSAADLEGNMLSVVGQEFDDREAARQASRAAMLDQAALELQQYTADLNNDAALVNAEALRAQLEAAAREAREAALDRQAQRDYREAQARRLTAQAMRDERRAMGGGVARPHPVTATQLEARAQLIQSGLDPVSASTAAGIAPETAAGLTQSPRTAEQGTVAALENAVSQLEQLLPPEGEDIPGIGTLDSRTPEALTSDRGLDIQRAALAMTELYGRLHSQGAISPDELAIFGRILGTAPGSSDESIRRGIATVRREVAARLHGAPRADAAPDRDLDGAGVWRQ